MAALCYYCMTPTLRFGTCSVCGRKPSKKDDRSMALPPGTKLDNGSVIIGEKIGEGGFGITYIARDKRSDTNVCVKEFYPKQMTAGRNGTSVQIQSGFEEKYAHSMRAFNREARTIHELRKHPNIVNVAFTIDENNTSYYGMELLHGCTIEAFAKSWLRENGTNIDARTLCLLLNPIMDAIAFCHAAPIWHRDISPKNIMICGSDEALKALTNSRTFSVQGNRVAGVEPKLIDFGAAYTAMSNFTKSIQMVALEGFSSPEQALASKQSQGPWSDVYSFAATVYYCLTLKRPPSSLDLLSGQEVLERPCKLVPTIPQAVEEVILKGMDLNREKRYHDIRSFQVDFCRACSVKPIIPVTHSYGRLTCVNGPLKGKNWRLVKESMVLGRSDEAADIAVEDALVSRAHCRLDYVDKRWRITDLGSTNGTWFQHKVNGKAVMIRLDARREAWAPEAGFRIGRSTYIIEAADYDSNSIQTVQLLPDSDDTDDTAL